MALVALSSSINSLISTAISRTLYSTPSGLGQVTPLCARTFSAWTFLASIIRFWCAYRIDQPDVYALTLTTYLVVGAHFVAERLVFGTTKFGPKLMPTLAVVVVSVSWMVAQRKTYLS